MNRKWFKKNKIDFGAQDVWDMHGPGFYLIRNTGTLGYSLWIGSKLLITYYKRRISWGWYPEYG